MLLVGRGRLVELAAIDEHVAEQAVVDRQTALRDQPPRDRLGLREVVQAVQRMAAQQERCVALAARSLRSRSAHWSAMIVRAGIPSSRARAMKAQPSFSSSAA